MLQSKSGLYPERRIQVTTIPFITVPSDLELRDDNTNILKFENRLKDALLQRNITGLQLDIGLTRASVLKGIPSRLVSPLAELVQRMPLQEHWSLHDVEISRLSSDLATFASDVCGWPLPSGSVLVDAGRGCMIPEDDRFIDEAIRNKGSSKYSPSGLSTLTLVIEASSTILPEQINSYLSRHKPSEIPFSEVWIVHAYEYRAIALKNRSEA